jgi:uncharacterized protein (TIGR02421 family)
VVEKKIIKRIDTISDKFTYQLCKRLSENKQVRRSLPDWGRVHIDRQLPFLCVYRRRVSKEASISDGLVTGEASYLNTSYSRKNHKQLSNLVKGIASTLVEGFGSVLIVEVWISERGDIENSSSNLTSKFKIYRSRSVEIPNTLEVLQKSLKKIKVNKSVTDVEVIVSPKVSPPGMAPLLSQADAAELGCTIIGIEISPIYLGSEDGQEYPILYRKLKRGLSLALKNSFFEFTISNTLFRPPHFQSLGRRSVVKSVWEVDRQLATINKGFDFLLQVTPINNDAAWTAFKRNNYKVTPQFTYRPLSIDPALAKRRLFQIPIEKIEDPTLAQLFRDQQLDLDRKLTMLIDRGTPNFISGSLQLFGSIEDELMRVSIELLEKTSPRSREGSPSKSIDSATFKIRAEKELEYFRKTLPEHASRVVIKESITGLMVSQGNLLIGTRLKIPNARVEALIAHEVGTHVLTYLNGRSQKLQQLYIGLPGYDELQEGLAVLSEYLVGGLNATRMRLLAARVVAAKHLVNGADFIEVFNLLNVDYGFERRAAFNICTRTFRGGGLTKDAVYLRGLVQLLEYLKNGGELEPLYIGKVAVNHIAIIKELQYRKVLHPAPLLPAYMEDAATMKKLKELRNGITVLNLINRRKQ